MIQGAGYMTSSTLKYEKKKPFAMLHSLDSLFSIHDSLSFILENIFLATHTDDQVGIRDNLLTLLKLSSMSIVKEIINSICVNSYLFLLTHQQNQMNEEPPQRLNTNNGTYILYRRIKCQSSNHLINKYRQVLSQKQLSYNYQRLATTFFKDYIADHYLWVIFVLSFTAYQLEAIQIPYQLSIAILWLVDLNNILQCKQLMKSNFNDFKAGETLGKRCQILLYEYAISIVAKLMLVIIVQADKGYFYLLIIPVVLMFLLRIRIYLMEKDDIECFSLINFTMMGSRLFMIMATTCVSLKLDGYSSWTWREVFWWFWVYLSICVGVAFAVILMTISDTEVKLSELKASFWCCQVCIVVCIGSSLWVTGTIDYLDYNQKQQSKLLVLIIFLIIHSGIFGLLSYNWKESVVVFITHMIINEELLSTQTSNFQGNIAIDTKESKRERQPAFQVPKILKRFSGTYFGVPNQQEQEELKKMKKKDQKKNKIESTGTQIGSREFILKKRTASVIQKEILSNEGIHAPKLSKTFQNQLQEDVFVLEDSGQEDKIRNKSVCVGTNPQTNKNLRTVYEEGSVILVDDEVKGNKYKCLPNQKLNDTILQFSPKITDDHRHRKSQSDIPNNKDHYQSDGASNREVSQAQQGEQSMSKINSSVQNCLVCFDKAPDAVYMMCGHGGICYDCSLDIWKTSGECYLCREKIAQVLQLDMQSKTGPFLKVISSTQMMQD